MSSSTAFRTVAEKKINVNAVDESLWTPLHWAAARGQLDEAKKLIDLNANVNAVTSPGSFRPLHLALRNKHSGVALLLLERGAFFSVLDDSKRLPLHYAAQHCLDEVLKVLLERGSDPNATDSNGWTPLHLAAEMGWEDVCEQLIKKGADVNAADMSGLTALHFAVECDHIIVVRLLLDSGADFRLVDKFNKRTAFHVAAASSSLDTFMDLLEKGADPHQPDAYGRTPFLLACEAGNISIVNFLLEKGASALDHDEGKRSPLHFAAENGHLAICRVLLDRGAQVDARERLTRRTAIHGAAQNGHIDIVEFLAENNADLLVLDDSGANSLHLAAANGRLQTTRFLVEKNVPSSVFDDQLRTPLHYAAENGHVDIVRVLVEHGASADAMYQEPVPPARLVLKTSPLQLAVVNNRKDVIQYLCESKANVDLVDHTGNSLLHIAADRGYVDAVKLLASHGAALDVVNRQNKTPLQLALLRGFSDVASLLVHQDASLEAPSGDLQDSPLYLALEAKYVDLFRLIAQKCFDRLPNSDRQFFINALLEHGPPLEECTMYLLGRSDPRSLPPSSFLLHNAAHYGCKDVVEYLLANGFDAEHTDASGRTAIEVAAASQHEEIRRILRQSVRKKRLYRGRYLILSGPSPEEVLASLKIHTLTATTPLPIDHRHSPVSSRPGFRSASESAVAPNDSHAHPSLLSSAPAAVPGHTRSSSDVLPAQGSAAALPSFISTSESSSFTRNSPAITVAKPVPTYPSGANQAASASPHGIVLVKTGSVTLKSGSFRSDPAPPTEPPPQTPSADAIPSATLSPAPHALELGAGLSPGTSGKNLEPCPSDPDLVAVGMPSIRRVITPSASPLVGPSSQPLNRSGAALRSATAAEVHPKLIDPLSPPPPLVLQPETPRDEDMELPHGDAFSTSPSGLAPSRQNLVPSPKPLPPPPAETAASQLFKKELERELPRLPEVEVSAIDITRGHRVILRYFCRQTDRDAEAALWSALEDAPALCVFETFSDFERYLSRPYCLVVEAPEETLRDYLKRATVNGVLSRLQQTVIARAMGDVLLAMKSHGLVHGWLTLDDFARSFSGDWKLFRPATMHKKGQRIMPKSAEEACCCPELARAWRLGKEDGIVVEPAMDLWRLGLVLAEVFTSNPVLPPGLSAEELCETLASDLNPVVRDPHDLLDDDAKALLDTILVKDLRKRTHIERFLQLPFFTSFVMFEPDRMAGNRSRIYRDTGTPSSMASAAYSTGAVSSIFGSSASDRLRRLETQKREWDKEKSVMLVEMAELVNEIKKKELEMQKLHTAFEEAEDTCRFLQDEVVARKGDSALARDQVETAMNQLKKAQNDMNALKAELDEKSRALQEKQAKMGFFSRKTVPAGRVPSKKI